MRPWVKALIVGLVLVVAVFGWARLRFDADVLNLLPEKIPAVKGLKWHQEHFSNADETIITLSHPDPEIVAEAVESLAVFFSEDSENIAEAEWHSPFSESADALAEILAWRWINESPESFEELAGRLNPESIAAELEKVREELAITFSPEDLIRLSRDPFGITRLPDAEQESLMSDLQDAAYQSSDGTFHVIYLTPASPLKDYVACAEWISFLQSSIQLWREGSNIEVGLEIGITGRPAFVAEASMGMKRDMEYTVPVTVAIIVTLFLAVHRRIIPLIWLVVLLAVIMALTLASGGIIFGSLNAISLGFAAILMGVTADFALVLYQDWKTRGERGEASAGHVTKGIIWSATTTALAFGSLALGSLPGLRQLGALVAIGVGIGAVLMITFYLRLAGRRNLESQSTTSSGTEICQMPFRNAFRFLPFVALVIIVFEGIPGFNSSIDPLRPANSEAQKVSDELRQRLSESSEPYLLFLLADNDWKLQQNAKLLKAKLNSLMEDSEIEKFVLPDGLLSHYQNQTANQDVAKRVIENFPLIEKEVFDAGFTEEAMILIKRVVDLWETSFSDLDGVPAFGYKTVIDLQKDSLGRLDDSPLMMGLVYPQASMRGSDADLQKELSVVIDSGELVVAGWQILGEQVLEVVKSDLSTIVVIMVGIILVTLWFTFRNMADWLRAVGAILVSGLILVSVMSLLNWEWNLMNLTAVPLLLGLSVDYSIHTQLALRRFGRDWGAMWRSTGSALLLCALTTSAGFLSLTFSSGEGLRDLGTVCGIGVLSAWITSVCILPSWATPQKKRHESGLTNSGPSALYGALLWRVGTCVVRVLPENISRALGRFVGDIYRRVNRKRAVIVRENLLPVVGGNEAEANAATEKLFRNFGEKLIDLWRFESGFIPKFKAENWKNWEVIENALSKKRGVLLVTLHLGNWEIGGFILAQKGVELFVVTNPEPAGQLTEIRKRARTQLGIRTIVIGDDPFQFIEVIKALESGAAVALLMDRPDKVTGMEVDLCGRKLPASSAATELARATGCAILPVCVLKQNGTFKADILKEVDYSRPQLRGSEERRELIQKIVREFEPVLRQNPEQWYQFIPVWKKDKR